MIDYNTCTYSNDLGAGGMQDIYALIVFGKEHRGTYVDIGCRHAVNHNNTWLLEQYGWRGLAVDCENYTESWEEYRPNTKYIHLSAFDVKYASEFETLNMDSPIDFLSIDLESTGDRFKCLKQIFETGHEFKAITIEHDAYCEDVTREKEPQREFLKERGYVLVKECEQIEDFWINPNYINEDQYKMLIQFNHAGDDQCPPQNWLRYEKNYDWTHFFDIINVEEFRKKGLG